MLNQRLDYADRVVDWMKDHLSKEHGTRMEWIIIALIAVEVVFETVHYLKSREEVVTVVQDASPDVIPVVSEMTTVSSSTTS